MSFSANVKEEICRLNNSKLESISILSAVIRNSGVISHDKIVLTTEKSFLARYLFNLIKINYDVICMVTVRKTFNFNKNLSYILTIKNKVSDILFDTSIINENEEYQNIPSEYIYSDEEEKRAYLAGCFLSCGSVNDPKTSRYHLEFLVNDLEYAEFISNLLNEYYLNSKFLARTVGYMIYIKEAERISDFLRIVKTYNAVLYFEDIRIYRDHKNMTNRLNNCEQANMDKIFLTASNQIECINYINQYASLDLLDDKTKLVAIYRLKYPETSLLELSEIISLETGNKITKSGINHRFRKIRELKENIAIKNNK